MALIWKDELTLANLEKFSSEFVKPAYLMAYKATLSKLQASGITVDALAKVFALRETYKDDEEDIEPEKAIANAIEPLLTKTQFANLHNDSIAPSSSDLPPAEELVELVDKVIEKANEEMPRYAPVYSGLKGTVIILTVVAVIVAAIVLICINPFSRLSGSTDGQAPFYLTSNARINPDYVITLTSSKTPSVGSHAEFNCGSIPVLVTVSGPDFSETDHISASDASGESIGLYQFEKDRFYYFTNGDGVYCVSAFSENGECASSFLSYAALPVSGTDAAPLSQYAVVSHGSSEVIELFDPDYISGAAVIAAYATASASDLSPMHLSVTEPALGTIILSGDGAALTYTAGEKTGLDCITMRYCTRDGRVLQYTLPVLVCNTAPSVDKSVLSAELTHTPTKSAVFAGRISASDSDCDSISFSLTDTANCSVILASDGSYLVRVNSDYSGSTASFTFTASDGLITTDPISMSFPLKNSLIDRLEFVEDIVFYNGDEYFYSFELPECDLDGDPLVWTIITPLSDGVSQNGSKIAVSPEWSALLYQPGEDMNRNTSELISLICSDGWMQSATVSFIVNITENQPPTAGDNNRITIPLTQTEVTCTLSLKDDFELDKCVIDGVSKAVGGNVADGTGWDQLVFTFRPDGTETDCYVIFTVRDILTEKTSDIRFNITRE